MQEDKKQIYEALSAIMAETKAIGKTERNNTQNFMFRGIDNVLNELHALFAKHGVFILPEIQDFKVDEKTTAKGSIIYYTRATIKFRFVAQDGSEVAITNVGEAMDTGDKGMNKAMSIALKYALIQMLLIPTIEEKDPDAQTPPETVTWTDAQMRQAVDEINSAKDMEELSGTFNKWRTEMPQIAKAGTAFYKACQVKGKELKNLSK